MKTRYKYLIVNTIWCLILSVLINIIFYLRVNEYWFLTNKVLIVLLVVSSLLSQLDASKSSDEDFIYNFFNMRNVFYGTFFIFSVGYTCVIVLHCFFDYQSFYFKKYLFAGLAGLTFCVGICRIYLNER